MTEITTIAYIIIALIVYSSTLISYFLSNILKKETKEYKDTFVILSKIILAATLPIIILFVNNDLVFTAISAYLLIIVALFIFKPKSVYIYPILGLIIYYSSNSPNMLFIEGAIIFLYGLVSNPAEMKKKKTANIGRIIWEGSFLLTALIPLLLKAIF